MKQVNVHEAKSQLSKLLALVERGEEVVISRAGKPVARLVPVNRKPKKRVLGLRRGEVEFAPDFDEADATIQRLFEESGE